MSAKVYKGSESGHLKCPKCSHLGMARQARAGFWEERVYPLFGYYPWECAYCRVRKLMRDRGIRVRVKRRSTEGAETRS